MTTNQEILSSIWISIKSLSLSMFFVLLIGTYIAYILSQYKFKGKRLFETILILPLVLPPTVLGYYLILLFGSHSLLGKLINSMFNTSLIFTWYAASLSSFLVALPLMIKTTTASMKSIEDQLIMSSYLLGHSRFKTFIKVIIPISKRGILAGFILSFCRGLGEFGATLMFAGNIQGKTTTMPLAIYNFNAVGDFKSANILAISLTLISLIFLYLSSLFLKDDVKL